MLQEKDFQLASKLHNIERKFAALYKAIPQTGMVEKLNQLQTEAKYLQHLCGQAKLLFQIGIFSSLPKNIETDIGKILAELGETTAAELQELGNPVSARFKISPSSYPTNGNILYVNNTGALDSDENVLGELENIFPDAISRTISMVGPCGAGKSSIIRAITPQCCPKPAVSDILQAVPTSGNVHVFDTFLDLTPQIKNSVAPQLLSMSVRDFGELTTVRILDVEGFDGAKEKLPQDIENSLQTDGREQQERDRFAVRRWERVQEFPRLCYALSDVIVYVEIVPISRDLTNQLAKFTEKMRQGMGFVWPPDLIIVSNKVSYEEASEDYRLRTERWKNTHDKNNYFRYYFHSVTCFALPARSDPQSDKLWRDKIRELMLLINGLLSIQADLRKRRKAIITRRKWCHLVRGVVNDFAGIIDPTRYLNDDLGSSDTLATKCYWKFMAVHYHMRKGVNNPPITNSQLTWILEAMFKYAALLEVAQQKHLLLSTSTDEKEVSEEEVTASAEVLRAEQAMEASPSSLQMDVYVEELSKLRETVLTTALKKLKKSISFHTPCAAVHPTWRRSTGDPLCCRLERHNHSETHQTDVDVWEMAMKDVTELRFFEKIGKSLQWTGMLLAQAFTANGRMKTWEGDYLKPTDDQSHRFKNLCTRFWEKHIAAAKQMTHKDISFCAPNHVYPKQNYNDCC